MSNVVYGQKSHAEYAAPISTYLNVVRSSICLISRRRGSGRSQYSQLSIFVVCTEVQRYH